MKKSTVACASIVAGIFLWGAVSAGAEPKKDVSDPVLQEIIASFGPRMPRFVDRHGKDLFVADEPMTRGSLLNALYEYDKSLKLPKKDFVTRQEFDELRAKVAQSQQENVSTGKAAGSGRIDIMEVINDLQPNMPLLLDNSLNNSKVFNNLKEEVMGRRTSGSTYAGGGGDIVNKQEFNEIRGRLAALEKNLHSWQNEEPTPVKAAGNPGAYATERMRRELVLTRQELASLNNRITELERTSSGGNGSGGESRSYSTALTKISLGLSMVAALFIAR